MKTSYFSISKSLIKENLRRFWMLSLVAFLAYFISSVLPILIAYTQTNAAAEFINMLLKNEYPVYWGISLLVPIAISIVVFRYLHNSSSITMMHAMPFTRAKLFNSNVVSGLILCMVPVILIGIILMCIAKPTTASAGGPDIFSNAAILRGLFKQLLLVFSVYSISIFVSVITGNGVIQFLTALWFNVLPATLYLIFIQYFNGFLYGYVGGEEYAALKLSPFFGIIGSLKSPFELLGLLYFVVSLGFILLSSFLYHKRKLEYVRTPYVFQWATVTICFLLAFYGAILLGILFYAFDETNAALYLSLIIGGMICLIISTMIVKQTFKVFNKKFLQNTGIFMVVIVLFMATIFLDLTGFETRVPKVSNIKQVDFAFSDVFNYSSQFSQPDYDYVDQDLSIIPLKKFALENTGSSVDNIERIRNIHEKIVNDTDRIDPYDENYDYDDDYNVTSINFQYTLKGDSKLLRGYDLSSKTVSEMKELKALYESKEFKEFYSLEDITIPKQYKSYITSNYREEGLSLNKTQQQEILDCMEKDFQASHYEDQFSKKSPYATLVISDPMADEEDYKEPLRIDIKPTDQNAIKWLVKHGYDKKLTVKLSDVKEIAIRPLSEEEDNMGYDLSYYDTIPKNAVRITDPKQIEKILPELGTNESNIYLCAITFKESAQKDRLFLYYEGDPLPSFLKGKL